MDLSFTTRVRKQRRRDLLAPRDLPLLFVRLAGEQACSVTALAQGALDRDRDTWTPFAQRIAIFTGTLPANARSIYPRFAAGRAAGPADCGSSTQMKPPFTLALQRIFKREDLMTASSIEQLGALSPARGPND